MSQLSVHVVNRLLRENWKSIPKFKAVKTLKKCNPLDFKFDLGKLTNKTFLHIV